MFNTLFIGCVRWLHKNTNLFARGTFAKTLQRNRNQKLFKELRLKNSEMIWTKSKKQNPLV